MGANTAGIYGAQIFREDDKPKYRRGFGINIGVLTLGLSMATARWIDDLFRRRKAAKQLQLEQENGSDDKAARPSDVQPAPILIGDDKKPVVGN